MSFLKRKSSSALFGAAVALAGVLSVSKVSAQVEGPFENGPISIPVELAGEQKLVSFDESVTFGVAFFWPSTTNPGDYEILTSPIGPGYAFHDAAVPGNYVLVFGQAAFDMIFDAMMGVYRLDVGGIGVYLTGDPDATSPYPGLPDPPVIDVELVELQDGSEAHRSTYASGSGLIGLSVLYYRTMKVCATFDFIGPGNTVVTGFPVPAGSTFATTGNGGQPVAADCTTVYCASRVLGNAAESTSNWGPAGGSQTFLPGRASTPNFAGRIAADMGMSVTQIVNVRIVTHYTEWIVINGYVVAKIEFSVTQECPRSNGYAQSGPTVITTGTITHPANGAMDNDDAAAIALFNAGFATGAACAQ